MEYISIYAIILINAVAITIKFKNRIEINIPISVVLIVLVIYILGLFNQLTIGVTLIIALTVVSLIYCIYSFIKKKDIKIKEQILTPGLMVYILLGIISAIFNKDRVFCQYDDFTHWGLIVKNMFYYGNYGTDGVIEYGEYPPFVSIFQYIILVFKRTFSEDSIIIGLNFLYFSFIMPFLKNIKWDKSILKLIVLVPSILLIPIIFYEDFYTDLFVDGFLGVLFAYIIYSWFREEKLTKMLSVGAGIIAITLTKSIGIALAIIAIIIFAIDILLAKKEFRKRNLIEILILVAILIIAIGSWKGKILIDNSNIKWNTNEITIGNIIKVLKEDGEAYQKRTLQNFKETVFTEQGTLTSRGMNTINLLMFLIASGTLTYILIKDKQLQKRFIVIQIIAIISWIIFIFGMLIMYLFIFTKEEALILACYERYALILPLGIIIIDVVFLEDKWKKVKLSQIVLCLSLILVFMPLQTIYEMYYNNDEEKAKRIEQREPYKEILKYSDKLNEEAEIYYISNFVGEKEIALVRYEMLPIKIQNKSSKLTMTREEFIEEIINNGYTHIYINENDRVLTNQFIDLFENNEIKSKTMYKIQKEEDKIVFLEFSE